MDLYVYQTTWLMLITDTDYTRRGCYRKTREVLLNLLCRISYSDAKTDRITDGYILFIKEVRLCSQPLGESLAALTHILINLKQENRLFL